MRELIFTIRDIFPTLINRFIYPQESASIGHDGRGSADGSPLAGGSGHGQEIRTANQVGDVVLVPGGHKVRVVEVVFMIRLGYL